MYCSRCNLKTPPTLSRCPQCQGWLKPSVPEGVQPQHYPTSSAEPGPGPAATAPTEGASGHLADWQPTGRQPEPPRASGDLSEWQPTGRSNYRPYGVPRSEQSTQHQASAAMPGPARPLPVTWLALVIFGVVGMLGLVVAPPPSSDSLPEDLPSQALVIGKPPAPPKPTDLPEDRTRQQNRLRGAWLVDRAVRLYSTKDYLPASEAASQALEAYQESDAPPDQRAAAHFWLGVSEARLENLDEARKHLAEAARLQPQNTKYQRTLEQFDAHRH